MCPPLTAKDNAGSVRYLQHVLGAEQLSSRVAVTGVPKGKEPEWTCSGMTAPTAPPGLAPIAQGPSQPQCVWPRRLNHVYRAECLA